MRKEEKLYKQRYDIDAQNITPDYIYLMKMTFKYVWMQIKLFTILYQVIKTAI